ncbi:glycerol-3-phosphate dehydrogenase/oxidase [Actinopolymorpha rutila]|uniref:Glycerol-3-phosphate dehydrogenase n=1 Tax=Actinopolymorpha rutila TaxID=446787 RepID=A0A852Z764_9ACTN|nr:glycerol-3-phosphate dehydrogenase [Actinopolymorpha rutila]
MKVNANGHDRTALSADRRRGDLAGAAGRDFDVVVVGGGVTGAGVALDATARGLSVLLLEADDLASGTSSRSGKVFHGGLRYLEQLNFALVREALLERDLMVERLCPHLVESEPFLFPFTKRWQRPYIGAGVAMYDLFRLTGPRSVPGHRHLTRRAALAEMPGLRPDDITGAVQYHDVRVDDARHTMTLARTAAGLGATVLTRTRVVGMLRDGQRVTGVRVHDLEDGGHVDVLAGVVVNAAGVWADEVQSLGGSPSIAVRPAKGVHLVVPADRIDSRTGLIARTSDSVFIIRKWFDHWLMGTTDTPWDHDRGHPVASREDVDYLLGQANRWLKHPLGDADVVGVYAGLRPLLAGVPVRTRGGSDGSADSATTAALRRDHTVVEQPAGLVTVVGGKYTTYRLMARDAVDATGRSLGRTIPASSTDKLPLLGATGYVAVRHQRDRLAREAGLEPEQVEHLLGRYGALTPEVLDLLADRPELARPLPGASHYLAAEVAYAARSEGALHLMDALARRTRVFMETADRGVAAAPEAARVMASVLGWDEERRAAEVAAYTTAVEAERHAATMPTDDQAVQAWQTVAGAAAR